MKLGSGRFGRQNRTEPLRPCIRNETFCRSRQDLTIHARPARKGAGTTQQRQQTLVPFAAAFLVRPATRTPGRPRNHISREAGTPARPGAPRPDARAPSPPHSRPGVNGIQQPSNFEKTSRHMANIRSIIAVAGRSGSATPSYQLNFINTKTRSTTASAAAKIRSLYSGFYPLL